MNLRKMFVTGTAAALFISSALHVSAAETTPSSNANSLKESNQENLILDVEAYKAAYSDLAEAFGDDTNAYIEHYLTIGVYEGRTKGVLFDPLVYVESYSDVKNAFGYNIPAIVNHYLKFGIAENRTLGTANGYADLAAAEKAGAQKTNIERSVAVISNYDSNTIANTPESNTESTHPAADAAGNVISNGNSALTNANAPVGAGTTSVSNNTAAGTNSTPTVNNAAANNTTASNNSAPVVNNAAADNSNTPADNASASSNTPAANTPASGNVSASSSDKGYHHTTSIYDNDEKTLLRVEYYDDNNKLIQYSSVSNFDSSTNSYTEEIYHYDYDTESSVLDRTDTYVNGSLSSSENH